MDNAERIRHLKHRLNTRAGTAEIGSIVHAMARLGVLTMVVKDKGGEYSLAIVTGGGGAQPGTYDLHLERQRGLTRTEADVAREHGAGYFEGPAPIDPVPDEHVQG